MVDTCVSGAYGAIHAGSSPAFGIFCEKYQKYGLGTQNPTERSSVMVHRIFGRVSNVVAKLVYRFSGQSGLEFLGKVT